MCLIGIDDDCMNFWMTVLTPRMGFNEQMEFEKPITDNCSRVFVKRVGDVRVLRQKVDQTIDSVI